MTVGSAAALFGTMILLSLAPSPTEIALVARSITFGIKNGFLMVAGIVFADFLFIIAAVIGLATIAELLGPLFVVVQSIAGVYLIYIGVVQFRREALTAEPSTEATSSGSSSFLSGFVLTFGDPKAIFGYASLLPAFVDLTAI